MLGRIEKSVEIKALPEEVWPLLFFDRLPEWLDIFKKVECTSQKRDCAGAIFHVVGETAFMKTEFDVEITELVENEKAGWRSTLGGFGKSSLNPTAAGTELNFIINYALPYSIFGKILDKLIVGREIEKSIEKGLEKLKSILEDE